MSYLPLSPAGQCLLFLALAVFFLNIALRMFRRAAAPLGILLQAAAAAAALVLAISLSFAFLAAAAVAAAMSGVPS